MLKRTMIYLLLVAMSNLILAGCAEYTKMSLSDVLNSKHKRVSEVTTNNGEQIVFDSAGAKYIDDSKSILGITSDGQRAHKFTSDLDKITLVDTTGEDTLPLVLPAGELTPHFSQKRFDRISSVFTKQGEQFRFNSLGATIDRPDQTIKGTTLATLQSARHSLAQSEAASVPSNHVYAGNYISGSAVAVPFDNVDYVTVHQSRDTGVLKGLLIAGGIAAFLYFLATELSNDPWEDFNLDGLDDAMQVWPLE